MPEKTEVRYDVSKALKELDKLRAGVKKAAGETKKKFREAGDSTKKFDKVLGDLTNRIPGLNAGMTRFASIAGKIGPGFTFAGAAIGITVANMVQLSSQLEDIDKRIAEINKTAERTLRFQNLASSVGDAQENRRIREARRLLNIRQAEVGLRQAEVDQAKELSARLVQVRRDEFRQIDAAYNRSVQNRLSAEERLKAKLSEGQIVGSEFAGQAAGRQVRSLAAKARQEASKGNIEAAEALVDRAKQLSAELGNHILFTKDIDSANSSIVKALEKNVNESKKQEDSLKTRRDKSKQELDAAEKLKMSFDAQTKAISRANIELEKRLKLLRAAGREAVERQQIQEGQRTVQTGINQVRDSSGIVGGQALVGQFRDALGELTKATFSPGAQGTFRDTRDEINAIASQVASRLRTDFADGAISSREAQGLGEFTSKLSDLVGSLRAQTESGAITGGGLGIQRLENLFQGLENIVRGAELATAGGLGFDTGITAANTTNQAIGQERAAEQQRIEATFNLNFEGGVTEGDIKGKVIPVIERLIRTETARLPRG